MEILFKKIFSTPFPETASLQHKLQFNVNNFLPVIYLVWIKCRVNLSKTRLNVKKSTFKKDQPKRQESIHFTYIEYDQKVKF